MRFTAIISGLLAFEAAMVAALPVAKNDLSVRDPKGTSTGAKFLGCFGCGGKPATGGSVGGSSSGGSSGFYNFGPGVGRNSPQNNGQGFAGMFKLQPSPQNSPGRAQKREAEAVAEPLKEREAGKGVVVAKPGSAPAKPAPAPKPKGNTSNGNPVATIFKWTKPKTDFVP